MRRGGRIALVFVLSIALIACVLEEEFRFNADGSGTYQVKVSVPKQFASAMGDIHKEAASKGFRIIAEGETETHKFFTMAKDFTNVSDLSDSSANYDLDIQRQGSFRTRYTFHATVAAAQGFKREMKITLPVSVSETTAGTISGGSVTWDGSAGGSITITGAGMSLPLTGTQLAIWGAIVLVGILLLIAIRARRRRSPACAQCGASVQASAHFCNKCGAATPSVPIPSPTPTT